jgi:hypothetical protein
MAEMSSIFLYLIDITKYCLENSFYSSGGYYGE